MMSLIQKPIILPADMNLPRAAEHLRAKAEELAERRSSGSALIEIGHQRVALALEILARDCVSTSQLPACEEARCLWATGQLPRVEVSRVGCMVPGELHRR
jgi:hypothetical protein